MSIAKLKTGKLVVEFEVDSKIENYIPKESEVVRCFYYNEKPIQQHVVSYKELFLNLLDDNTEVFLFGVSVHDGKIKLANGGKVIHGVATRSFKHVGFEHKLQTGVIHYKKDGKQNIAHINVKISKQKKDGTASKQLIDISYCNIWATSLEEAKLKFHKAKEEAVAIAKEQIEKEHSQKLEDLELFVKENLL